MEIEKVQEFVNNGGICIVPFVIENKQIDNLPKSKDNLITKVEKIEKVTKIKPYDFDFDKYRKRSIFKKGLVIDYSC